MSDRYEIECAECGGFSPDSPLLQWVGFYSRGRYQMFRAKRSTARIHHICRCAAPVTDGGTTRAEEAGRE